MKNEELSWQVIILLEGGIAVVSLIEHAIFVDGSDIQKVKKKKEQSALVSRFSKMTLNS